MRAAYLSAYLSCLSLLGHSTYVFGQTATEAESRCGPLLRPQGQYGPYDFRTNKDKLPVVVNNHFTPIVEQLIGGQTSISPGGDIDFTLRAIPNHPNALMSMMLLGEKEKTDTPRGSRYTMECWFERAIRFSPDDNVVRMIYTTYLIKTNRHTDAQKQLAIVLATAKDNAFTHNNVGLLYFDLGDHQKALVQAHKAMELGLNRPALREKLQSVGKWSDPDASTSEQAAPLAPSLATSAAKAP